ncbi:hypothetical protein M0802_007136 [Mischocyttarus mexicanus]|nr:hypothetical protein M0802_007136 [Mischocyttarus mexicanus]
MKMTTTKTKTTTTTITMNKKKKKTTTTMEVVTGFLSLEEQVTRKSNNSSIQHYSQLKTIAVSLLTTRVHQS